MTQPFVGEIVMFGANFAPRGWARCDGQLLAISQNGALFSILGTLYGGDGETTFGLPELRGRLPIHQGAGPGLANRSLGSKSGVEEVGLNVNQMPPHKHAQQGSTDTASDVAPAGKLTADAEFTMYSDGAPNTAMSTEAIGDTGGNQDHENLMPFQVVNFIIALTGIFPSSN